LKEELLKQPPCLENKFDKIFFHRECFRGETCIPGCRKSFDTGNAGTSAGKSPVIIEKDANLSMAARRLVWAKFLNAGPKPAWRLIIFSFIKV